MRAQPGFWRIEFDCKPQLQVKERRRNETTGRTIELQLHNSNNPLVAMAVHNGHKIRNRIVELMAITEDERRRGKDPFTGNWTTIVRFEKRTTITS